MPKFSKDLEKALGVATTAAATHKHEYMLREHLLLGLLGDTTICDLIEACGGDVAALRTKLEDYIANELTHLVDQDISDPRASSGFERIIQRAVMRAGLQDSSEVQTSLVFTAVFDERESHAAYFLSEQNITKFDVVNYVARGIRKVPPKL